MISSYGQSNPHSASLPHTFNVQSISGLLPKPTCGTGAASLSNQEQLSLEAPVPVNVPADRRISVVIRAPICVTLVAQTAEDACLAQQDKHRLQRRALEVIQNQHHLKVVRNTNDGSVQCVEAIPAAWLSPKSVTRLVSSVMACFLYCALSMQLQ